MGRCLTSACVALALWPTFRFCVDRMHTAEDVACLAAALATAAAAAFRRGALPVSLVPASLAMGVYALCLRWAPPLVGALAGMVTLGALLGTRAEGKSAQSGVTVLLCLALPLIPTLEFTLGHPLRVVATHGAQLMLGLMGQAVEPEGTCLRGDLGVVCVDAPCAGVRMLWTTGFCVGAVSAWRAMSWSRTLALGLLGLPAVIAGNMMRTASLFVAESRATLPVWLHEGVGLGAFVMVLGCVAAVAWKLVEEKPCAA